MSTEENKALVRRWLEESLLQGNLDLADEIIAPDFIYHGTDVRGIDGHKAWITWASTLAADGRLTFEDMVAEGNKVVFRVSLSGTHQAEWLGIPATGKHFETTQTGIVRIANGKITELWDNWDALGVFRQLGGIPSMDESEA